MLKFFKLIKHKVNGVIWALTSTGFILLMLGVLITWYEFMLRFVVGLFVFVVSFVFLYSAYKLWVLKKDIEKYFKL